MSKLITLDNLNKNNDYMNARLIEIKDYIGYTDNDIYGLEVNYENNIFTRLAGSIGKSGGSDFDNVNAFGGRKRCNLTDDGIVTAYYGDTAYTETGVLTQSVTINNIEYPVGTAVQVMVEQPKFYYKVIPLKLESYTTQNGDIGYHIRKARYYISDTPKNGFKLHPAFIRNGAEKEKIYLSAYEGCLYDVSESSYITDDAQVADFNADKMSSIANAKPMSGLTQNLTRANARKLANNRGTGWEQMYVHTASATQLLFIIEYGTLNSQQVIGNGVVNKADNFSTNIAENTGGTSSLGNTSGSVSNNEISYRGEENFWGNIWKWEDGINIQNPSPFNYGEYSKVYIADNNFADDTNSLPYEDINIYPCKATGAWISAFGYNEKFDWIFIPTKCNNTSSLSIGDTLINPNTSWRMAGLGGEWNDKFSAGAFYLSFYSNSLDHALTVSSRLVYIPNGNESNRTQKQLDEDLTGIDTLLIDNACKNLFDYDKWVGTGTHLGTAIYENYGVTLTANGDDCYLNYRADNSLNIPVQVNKTYILSWDCSSENSDLTEDRVYVFFNGLNDYHIQVHAIDKQLQFTVPENITFITIRFGVQNNGNTVSYSNIMIRRAEITDDTFELYYRTQKQLDDDLTKYVPIHKNGNNYITSRGGYAALYVDDSNGDSTYQSIRLDPFGISRKELEIYNEESNCSININNSGSYGDINIKTTNGGAININSIDDWINIESDEGIMLITTGDDISLRTDYNISIDASNEINMTADSGVYITANNSDINITSSYIDITCNNTTNQAGAKIVASDNYIKMNTSGGNYDAFIEIDTTNQTSNSTNTDILIWADRCINIGSGIGDISLNAENIQVKLSGMSSEVTLKAYIQGVINGTY